MIYPDDANDLMEYFRVVHPDVDEPRHLPDKKDGPATLIGGRYKGSAAFMHVSHDDLRRRKEHYSIDNDRWWTEF